MNHTKMKGEAVQAPTEDAWNKHKELLRILYFNSTLPKLKKQMNEDFHFIASKNQYERKFNEWDFKKNFTSEDREHIIRKKRKRDEAEMETQVIFHGVKISTKRLKKEESRYSLSDLTAIYSSYPTAPSPEGISVATPPPASFGLITNIQVDNLPSFGLGSISMSKNGPQQLIAPRKEALKPSQTISISPSNIFSQSMPPRSIVELLKDPDRPSTVSTIESFETIFQQLRVSTIEIYDGETEIRIARLLDSHNVDAFQDFMIFIAQLGSNNALEYNQITRIYEWISEQNMTFLESLIELRNPAVQACLETLINDSTRWGNSRKAFTAVLSADKNRRLFHGRREHLLCRAIEAGYTDTVKSLIEEGIDVNCRVNRSGLIGRTHSITLLGAARNAKTAKILIEAHANVNTPAHDFVDRDEEGQFKVKYYSPIYYAARGCDHALFQVLLDAKAHFDPLDVGVLSKVVPKSFLGVAIERKCIETVKILLRLGVECSTLQAYQSIGSPLVLRTELQQACHMGEIEIVKALLATSSGKHALQTSPYRWGPLRDAAMQGHFDVVELLITASADVNATSQDSQEQEFEVVRDEYMGPEDFRIQLIPSTALMAAVEAGHFEIVESLLSHGAKVNAAAVGSYGTSVLAMAERIRSHDIASALRKAGAVSQSDSQRLICDIQFAAARKDLHKVREILALGVNASHILDTSSAIVERTSGNSRNIVSTFLAVCGGKIDSRGPESGSCALEFAIDLGDVTLIQKLGDAGANFKENTSCGLSLLQHALKLSCGSNFELIDSLLYYGASTDVPSKPMGLDKVETPLQIAATLPDHRILERLLLSPCQPSNATSPSTILAKAFNHTWRCPGLPSIHLLLDHGADVNAREDKRYSTILQRAAGMGSVEIVKELLQRGADINAATGSFFGRTALQAAIDSSSPDFGLIQLLINNGADINAPASVEGGVTALQVAAIRGYLKIALMLLEMGADPNAPGSQRRGRTALKGAAEHGRIDMVQLLLNGRAEPTQSAIDFATKEGKFVVADILKSALEAKEMEPFVNFEECTDEILE